MLKNATILMAEDDIGHAHLIRVNLKRAGISNKILNFEDGESVWNFLICKKNAPTEIQHEAYLLLLDIRMPKINGIEILRRIKCDDKLKIIPVIILTTTGDPEIAKQCDELGSSGFITKPIEYDEFVTEIQELAQQLQIIEIPEFN